MDLKLRSYDQGEYLPSSHTTTFGIMSLQEMTQFRKFPEDGRSSYRVTPPVALWGSTVR